MTIPKQQVGNLVFGRIKKRAGLGEARNYKTGAAINSWDEWKAARKECIGKGRADGGDESVRREAVKDVLEFLKEMK